MPAAAVPDDGAPTYSWVPEHATSGGPEAIELAASAGLVLDPWQETAITGILAEDAAGKLVAFESGVIVSRQNGKGAILEALALYWLFLEEVELILWSAHEFKTAAEAFRRMRVLLQGAPDLWPMVSRITTANGDEAIELATGQRLKFVARSKSSGRGFTGDKIILDEAYDLPPDVVAALLPTLTTRPDAQLVYTSSAGNDTSDVLRSVRDRGRAGGDPSLCWMEWCALPSGVNAQGDPVYNLDDRAEWRRANPASRVTVDFMGKERRAMSAVPEKFLRERMGVWDEPGEELRPIRPADWRATKVDVGCVPTEPHFFIVIGVDGGAIVTGAFLPPGSNDPMVMIAHREPDLNGLADRLEYLSAKYKGAYFGANKSGPVAGLVESESLLVDIDLLSPSEMAQACRHHEALSKTRAYSHVADERADISYSGAVSKPAGDGMWVWDWRKSDQLAHMAAYTGALWMFEKHRHELYDVLDSVL